jgi:hypothetical protein
MLRNRPRPRRTHGDGLVGAGAVARWHGRSAVGHRRHRGSGRHCGGGRCRWHVAEVVSLQQSNTRQWWVHWVRRRLEASPDEGSVSATTASSRPDVHVRIRRKLRDGFRVHRASGWLLPRRYQHALRVPVSLQARRRVPSRRDLRMLERNLHAGDLRDRRRLQRRFLRAVLAHQRLHLGIRLPDSARRVREPGRLRAAATVFSGERPPRVHSVLSSSTSVNDCSSWPAPCSVTGNFAAGALSPRAGTRARGIRVCRGSVPWSRGRTRALRRTSTDDGPNGVVREETFLWPMAGFSYHYAL